jgi:hypothetical protein
VGIRWGLAAYVEQSVAEGTSNVRQLRQMQAGSRRRGWMCSIDSLHGVLTAVRRAASAAGYSIPSVSTGVTLSVNLT